MSELGQYERAILAVLAEDGGFTTGHIAKSFYSPFNRSTREHSSDVRAWLVQMKRDGLVALLDNNKPAVWIRTDAGALALKQSKTPTSQ